MSKIPPVTRKHVELALDEIDLDGVPPRREATGYVLLANGRRYPPKYVLALAVKHATGKELPSEEFSGGEQTNSILRELGFKVDSFKPQAKKVPPKPSPATRIPSAIRQDAKGHAVVTVILEKQGNDYDYNARLDGMAAVLDAIADAIRGKTVVLFPGGWFKAGQKRPTKLLQQVERDVLSLLRSHDGRFAVSFGLDGRRFAQGTLDQLAVAMTADGISGIGRKFFPASKEIPELAASWDTSEGNRARIASLFGKRYYLAVCYDVFGIKKLGDVQAKVDAVLDHVHGFESQGRGNSGDVLFARHGFARAAQAWGMPVFGAAAFFDRPVPEAWPSGVVWRGPAASTTTWTYAKNGLSPKREIDVELPEGIARLRMFSPW